MTQVLGVADRMPVVDADSHVTEPPDLWTSRVAEKWRHLVPSVHSAERNGRTVERWRVGNRALVAVAELDRKSVVSGKWVSVRVDRGGRRIINKKTKTYEYN